MTVDLETGAYWQTEVGGAALGWAVPEEPGEPLERVPTDWTFPAGVLEGIARLAPFWEHVAETLTQDNVNLNAGQYTCTPDNKPIIGPCADVPGLYLSLGYSGHGIMASPGAGRLLADLIGAPHADAENPFSYQRFATEDAGVRAERIVI